MLPGSVGEENRYTLHPRGTVLCRAGTRAALLVQVAACLSTGNLAHLAAPLPVAAALDGLPPMSAARIVTAETDDPATCDAILFDGEDAALRALLRHVAAADGPIRPVLALPRGQAIHRLDMLVAERAVSTNTAAAGGNAALMSL